MENTVDTSARRPRPIQLMPTALAEKIAAGEVVERPASAVKELVENSIDAGAREICVALEDGGKSLIEVIDNGFGMSKEDLSLCLRRHATSKIRDLADLETLVTLGFRGEALPSIAAVSDLSIVTRAEGDASACEIEAQAAAPRAVTFGHFLGSTHGTKIQARNLFSTVPARQKFLKSQAAEVSLVREWLERLGLAHPEVSFRLVSGDRSILSLKGQSERSRVSAVLSDGQDFPLVTAEQESGALKVRMHWLQGMSVPHTRKVIQVVNGRPVRDRLLQQACLSPFRQCLLPGQFPVLALYLEIDPSMIDVNVHPTKTELRFLESREVFHQVESLIEKQIAAHGAPAYAGGPGSSRETALFEGPWQAAQRESLLNPVNPAPSPWSWSQLPTGSTAAPAETAGPPSSAPLHPFSRNQFAGMIFNTYLLYDLGTELGLIDQHAADERIRYERLKNRVFRENSSSSQSLLLPEAVHFSPELKAELESRVHWLTQLGFETEIFGESSLLFRAVPAEWGLDDLKTRLKNLLERTLAHPPERKPASLLEDEALFERLASEACHSSVRAGDRLDPLQAQALVDRLFQCQHPWNCPHGRPTVTRIPRARFEEWFQRRPNA